MRKAALLAVVLLSACGGPSSSPRVVDVEPSSSSSSPSASPSASPSPSPSPSPPPPPPPSPDARSSAGCVEDAQAKVACAARGAGFHYGPRPYVYCSGVAPRPEQERSAHEAIRKSACECVDEAALAAHQHECSRIPSAPPRR